MKTDEQRSQPAIWLSALAVLCVGILVWGLVGPVPPMASMAYAIGYAAGAGALGGFVFTMVFRRFWPGKGFFAFAAIGITMFGALLVSVERSRTDGLKVMEFIRSDMLGGLIAADPAKPIPNIASGESPPGDAGVLQRFLTTMYNHQAETQRAYLAKLDDIRWDTVLDPARIERDTTFAESDVMFTDARAAIAMFREEESSYMKSLDGQVRALDFSSDAVREDAANGLARGLVRNTPVQAQMWDLESQVVDRIEDVARILHDRRGAWTLEDGQLYFESAEDNDRYNAAFDAVDEVIARQDALRKSQLLNAQKMLDSVEQQLGKR